MFNFVLISWLLLWGISFVLASNVLARKGNISAFAVGSFIGFVNIGFAISIVIQSLF